MKRKTLRFQIYAAIALTFCFIAIIFSLILYPFEKQRRETIMRKIELSINAIVEQSEESIANEMFLQHHQAIELLIKKMLETEGIIGIGIYTENGRRFAVTDEAVAAHLTDDAREAASQVYTFAEETWNHQDVVTYTQPILIIGDILGYVKVHYSLTDVERESRMAIIIFIMLLLTILLVMTCLLNFLLTRFVIHPVGVLIHAMRKLEEGYFGEQVNLESDNEIGEMAQTFNQMSVENAKIYRELAELNKTLEQKVRQRTDELNRKNVKLKAEIEERRRAQKELRRAEKKYRSLFENAVEGIFQTAPDGRLISANPSLARIYGYDSPEDMYASATDFEGQLYVNPDDQEKLRNILSEKGKVVGFESQFFREDGTISWMSLNAVEVRDEKGDILFYEGSVLDVAERKLAEKEIQALNRALRQKNMALNETLGEVEEANNKIMQSIRYAKTIQLSLLPNADQVRIWLPHSFFIWEPRDVVGGDIFFVDAFEEGLVIAIIDCTGHGVPGAFMTMIASSALRRVTQDEGCHEPAEILKRLNVIVKTSLQQDTDHAFSDDGLDAAVCFVSKPARNTAEKRRLTFAGARLPLIYIQNGEVSFIKGDKQSIGYKRSDLSFNFTNHTIHAERDISFYLSTDGFWDQMSENKRSRFGFRSFGKRRFKTLLGEISDIPFEQQKNRLLEAFHAYKGEMERQDDVAVIGFGFK